jgi:hypothetical protein
MNHAEKYLLEWSLTDLDDLFSNARLKEDEMNTTTSQEAKKRVEEIYMNAYLKESDATTARPPLTYQIDRVQEILVRVMLRKIGKQPQTERYNEIIELLSKSKSKMAQILKVIQNDPTLMETNQAYPWLSLGVYDNIHLISNTLELLVELNLNTNYNQLLIIKHHTSYSIFEGISELSKTKALSQEQKQIFIDALIKKNFTPPLSRHMLHSLAQYNLLSIHAVETHLKNIFLHPSPGDLVNALARIACSRLLKENEIESYSALLIQSSDPINLAQTLIELACTTFPLSEAAKNEIFNHADPYSTLTTLKHFHNAGLLSSDYYNIILQHPHPIMLARALLIFQSRRLNEIMMEPIQILNSILSHPTPTEAAVAYQVITQCDCFNPRKCETILVDMLREQSPIGFIFKTVECTFTSQTENKRPELELVEYKAQHHLLSIDDIPRIKALLNPRSSTTTPTSYSIFSFFTQKEVDSYPKDQITCSLA